MKTEEFLLNELKKSFFNEVNNCYREEELVLVKTKIDQLITKEALKEIELIELIIKDKNLSKLKYSVSILLIINDVNTIFDDFNHEVFSIRKLLDQIIKKKSDNPKNKIFPYLWVKISMRYFKINEYPESEIVTFYKEFLENYDYLIELDDMSLDTDYLKFPSANLYKSKDLTIVFENAVKKYQDNYSFKELLILFYAWQRNYDKALTSIHTYLDSLPQRRKNFEYKKGEYREHNSHLGVLLDLTIINYNLNLYDKALESANLLLKNLSYTELVGYKQDIRGFETALFIRVDINLKNNNNKALEDDYRLIREVHTCLDYPNLENQKYKDAIEYLDYKGMLDEID